MNDSNFKIENLNNKLTAIDEGLPSSNLAISNLAIPTEIYKPKVDWPTVKVFVPNQSSHDFSDSERYGSIFYVTHGAINRFSTGNMARKWMEALLNSNSNDYILVTSLTILTCIGCAIFGYLHGGLNVLLFRNGKYVARSLDFRNLKYAVETKLRTDIN